jgi:hypothetical protein
VSRRIDPNSADARHLARAYLDERDTVLVRLREGHVFDDPEDVGPGPPREVVRQTGDVFAVPRTRADELVRHGIAELT